MAHFPLTLFRSIQQDISPQPQITLKWRLQWEHPERPCWPAVPLGLMWKWASSAHRQGPWAHVGHQRHFLFLHNGALKLCSQETQRHLWSRRLKGTTCGDTQCRGECGRTGWDRGTHLTQSQLTHQLRSWNSPSFKVALNWWRQVRTPSTIQELVWDALGKGLAEGKQFSPIKGNFKGGWF